MPTFEYAYHPSPFANSIAELLAHQNDPAAQAARIKGNLSARAIETSGQATSDLIRGITHAGTSALDSILQAQQQAPVVAANKIKVEQLQQAQGAQNELSRALEGDQLPAGDAGPRRPSLMAADGSYDLPAIGAWLNSRGAGAQAPEILQHLQQTNAAVADAKLKQKAAAESQTVASGMMAFTMQNGIKLGLTPEQAYTAAVVPAKRSGLFTPEQIDQMGGSLLNLPPDQLNARLTQMMDQAAVLGKTEPVTEYGRKDMFNRVLDAPASKTKDAQHVDFILDGTTPVKGAFVPDASGGKYFYNGEDVTGRASPYKAPSADPNAQHVDFILDGKPVKGAFIPDATGGKYLYNGQDVTARARPIPPASITLANAGTEAVSHMPLWSRDASRPSGPDANTVDPTIRMTPNGLYQAAIDYIQTGHMPPTGLGNTPGAEAKRAAIGAKVGAIAADAGMDIGQLRAFYRANSGSLTKQTGMLDAVQGFIQTADRNAALLDGVIAKIPDLGSSLLNKPLRALDQKALGSVPMSQFTTYLKSVQNEYARIVAQPNLVGQLTDSARHEATQLLDPDATVKQILASLEALKNEGDNRVISIGEQIQRTQARMKIPPPGGGSAALPGGAPTTTGTGSTLTPTPTKRYNPATGQFEDIKK